MDRTTDWPWSWEEEIQWKADLEERDSDFILDLITNAIGDNTTDSQYATRPIPEKITE